MPVLPFGNSFACVCASAPLPLTDVIFFCPLRGRGNICSPLFFFAHSVGRGLFARAARGDANAPHILYMAFCSPLFFFAPIGAGIRLRPPFLFSREKKKRAAPGAKKKEHPAALRCLGLLRIDGFLITERSAIWKFFRMRSTNSAAAANGCGKYCWLNSSAE